MREPLYQRAEDDFDLARHHVEHRGAAAFVGDVLELTLALVEELAVEHIDAPMPEVA